MVYLFLSCSEGDSNKNDLKERHQEEHKVERTYYQDVAPILSDNFLSCHTEEGSGPFSLDTYENVKALGTMIEDSV